METISVRELLRNFKTLCVKPFSVARDGEILGFWTPQGKEALVKQEPLSNQNLVKQEGVKQDLVKQEPVKQSPWAMHTVVENGRVYHIPGTPEEQGVEVKETKYTPYEKGTLGEHMDISSYLEGYKPVERSVPCSVCASTKGVIWKFRKEDLCDHCFSKLKVDEKNECKQI